jgi:hypothetical protein
MGAASMVGGVLVVNMFGSRMVDVGVSAYVWILLAVLAHLRLETQAAAAPSVASPALKPGTAALGAPGTTLAATQPETRP